jgi:hypothetical protein
MVTFVYSHEWIVIIFVFIFLMVAYESGYRSGNKASLSKKPHQSDKVSNIQAGLMGILGVMLAFSFSISSARFEQRRQLIITESLNIGTAYFRAGLLPDTMRKETRSLLRKYLNERINFYKTGSDKEETEKVLARTLDIQVQIWAITATMGRTKPTLNTNLVILSLNPMIDVSGNIASSFQNHVPLFIIFLLIFITICTILIIGYSHGLSSDRSINFMILLNAVLCAILLLILDLDSPTTGILKVDVYGLTQLKNDIEKYKAY